MDGQPVWLASLSRSNPITRERLPTTRWSPEQFAEAEDLLSDVLDGVGDESAQRSFRMQITLCRHRRVSDEEQARLPMDFWDAPPVGLAGGPVAILWETVPGSLSTKPCANPRRKALSLTDPDLWIPIECGECPSCLARARLDADVLVAATD